MTELNAPDDPKDLWLIDVPTHRMLMQGDIIATEGGPVCVVAHACSMRRGSDLHDTQTVAPLRDHKASWQGHYDWMPLPAAPIHGFSFPAACIRELFSPPTDSLLGGSRVTAMTDIGVHLLQQRMVHHLSRVIIDLAELAEHSAPILAEVDLHEEWVTDLGETAEPEFHRFLDADDRKLRNWLNEARTRPQVFQAVRREIRRQLSTG